MHIEIASMRQFQCVPTTYVAEIMETYFEIHVYIYQESCPFSLKHLNLPISIKILVTIWKIVYIFMTAISPNFDFMNYAFAKLVLVWL